MAASDHLSPGQFYHGTNGHDFKPGDVLTPEGAPARSTSRKNGFVYYTSSLRTAAGYAGSGKSAAHVYAVQALHPEGQPAKRHLKDPNGAAFGNEEAYRARALRVLHEVHPETGEVL